MAKIDQKLQRIFAWTVLVCVVLSVMSLYLYVSSQHKQAERELIYLKARNLAMQEQQKRARDYQKRLIQRRLTQEFNQGRVVDPTRPAQSAAPASTSAVQK